MISMEVQSALQTLQTYPPGGSVYVLDLIDRALDELLRQPDNRRPAAFQIRSARANAAKVVRDRRLIQEGQVLRNRPPRPGIHRAERLSHDGLTGVVELRDWLARTPGLNPAQRQILGDLADGHDAQSIADRDLVPVARVRERIARARQAARAAYHSVGLAA